MYMEIDAAHRDTVATIDRQLTKETTIISITYNVRIGGDKYPWDYRQHYMQSYFTKNYCRMLAVSIFFLLLFSKVLHYVSKPEIDCGLS